MKIIGLFRRFDELGRINIPREVRRQVFGEDCTEGKVMKILTDGDLIILKKHEEKECKPKTNADKIRGMSDEELAEWLTSITNDAQSDARTKCNYQWEEWLQSEVEQLR